MNGVSMEVAEFGAAFHTALRKAIGGGAVLYNAIWLADNQWHGALPLLFSYWSEHGSLSGVAQHVRERMRGGNAVANLIRIGLEELSDTEFEALSSFIRMDV